MSSRAGHFFIRKKTPNYSEYQVATPDKGKRERCSLTDSLVMASISSFSFAPLSTFADCVAMACFSFTIAACLLVTRSALLIYLQKQILLFNVSIITENTSVKTTNHRLDSIGYVTEPNVTGS